MLNHMLPFLCKYDTFTYSVPATFRLKYKQLFAVVAMALCRADAL